MPAPEPKPERIFANATSSVTLATLATILEGTCAPTVAPALATFKPFIVPAAPCAPILDNPAPRPAPPYAPRPAINPFFRSPVAIAVPPPTIPAAIIGPTPGIMERPSPATIGRIEDKKPASGRPVWGLIVREPPCAMAMDCRPLTSPGVIWTRTLSSLRPALCTWLAKSWRLIATSS